MSIGWPRIADVMCVCSTASIWVVSKRPSSNCLFLSKLDLLSSSLMFASMSPADKIDNFCTSIDWISACILAELADKCGASCSPRLIACRRAVSILFTSMTCLLSRCLYAEALDKQSSLSAPSLSISSAIPGWLVISVRWAEYSCRYLRALWVFSGCIVTKSSHFWSSCSELSFGKCSSHTGLSLEASSLSPSKALRCAFAKNLLLSCRCSLVSI